MAGQGADLGVAAGCAAGLWTAALGLAAEVSSPGTVHSRTDQSVARNWEACFHGAHDHKMLVGLSC